MKKYNEIIENINAEWKSVSNLKGRCDILNKELKSLFSDMSLKEQVEYHKLHKHDIDEKNNIITMYKEEIRDTELRIKIMENNAKIALFHEVMPVILDILKKYENKAHGEKTAKKIRDEIFEKTDCRCYISNASFKIYSRYDIECGLKYINGKKNSLLPNNKVYVPTMEELELYWTGDTYIEDIEYHIVKLKRLHMEIYNMKNELNNLMSKYNDLTVSGIRHLYDGKSVYNYIEFE